jgi:hypothetical protein
MPPEADGVAGGVRSTYGNGTVASRTISVAATYALGYTERCEHGRDPAGQHDAGSLRHALRTAPHDYLAD